MSNYSKMMFIVELSGAVYLIALALGYGWVRAMHYPPTLRQRKMWTYYVLFISALPVLNPLCVAMALWLMPFKQSAVFGITLLVFWMVIAFYIVRRMSKPGGRLSQERQGLP
jgi:drug/metabolite transporter (DMT)-like permease